MRELWAKRPPCSLGFDVEVALAKAQAKLGVIPAEAAEGHRCGGHRLDERIAAIGAKGAGHPLVLALDNLRSHVSPAGKPVGALWGYNARHFGYRAGTTDRRPGPDDETLEQADELICDFTRQRRNCAAAANQWPVSGSRHARFAWS